MVDYPELHPESRAEWRAWLEEHHAGSPGVWLVSWRSASGRARVPYADLVEEALCFGWVDSKAKRLDDDRSMITMTPRKPTSMWSRLNKDRVERLTAAGLMKPPGLRAVEVARANGSWEILDDIDALVVPEDLGAALAVSEEAALGFVALAPSARKVLLYAIKSAKRPETRARRIEAAVRQAVERAGRAAP